MGVVVFDSDVLIGFLNADDAHHQDAREWMTRALAPGSRRLVSAVNYAEILIGPLRAGQEARVEEMLVRFGIEVVAVDASLAGRAAAVRVESGLKLPDAFALATCLHMEQRGGRDVELASFDGEVLRARESLRPA